MKKCPECERPFQGHDCKCGYSEKSNDSKTKRSSRDEWILKQRQELNSLQCQYARMKEYEETAIGEETKQACKFLKETAALKLSELKITCQNYWSEICELPSESKCHGFDSGSRSSCTKFGLIAHLGSDSWFCFSHFDGGSLNPRPVGMPRPVGDVLPYPHRIGKIDIG
jgi:hypothetical protein